MNLGRFLLGVAGTCVLWAQWSTVSAASKYTMPNIRQENNTCYPSAASNLLYWFGKNGYPKLLPAADNPEACQRRIIAQILVHSQATFKDGTPAGAGETGLSQLFKERGYDAKITCHGLYADTPFDPSWLDLNRRDNIGFILTISYVRKNGNDYVRSQPSGHALTLLAYHNEVLVILDTNHTEGDPGRRSIRLVKVPNATYVVNSYRFPTQTLYELQGLPNMDAGETAILKMAICVEMPEVTPPTATAVVSPQLPPSP